MLLELNRHIFKKEIVRIINLYLPAQNIVLLTNLNAILGQAGVNSFEFSKKFNSISKEYLIDVMLKTKIFVYNDKSFDVLIDTPFSSFLINEEKDYMISCKNKEENLLIFEKKEEIVDEFSSLKKDVMKNTTNIQIHIESLLKISYFLFKIQEEKISLKKIYKILLGTLKSMKIDIIY